jgi:cyclophilin family peptidyl-prolyl cis-trans isomerase
MRKLKTVLFLFLVLVARNLSGMYDWNSPDLKGAFFSTQERQDGIYADFSTNKGHIIIRLEYKKAPMTVANFIGLSEGTVKNASYPPGVSFYKGSVWHRVVKGHVIQGGSPAVDKAPEKEEAGATGYMIPNEISDLSHNKAGMVGMANSGPHTNTCQYYITLGDRSYLDGNYTVFGEVVEGMDVVNNIVQGDTTYSIKILRIGNEAKNFVVNDNTFKVLVDKQWQKVRQEEAGRKAKDEKFISANYPGLATMPSGLRYKILVPGNGSKPGAGQNLQVKYSGRLVSGTSFGSSADAGKPALNTEPVVFTFIQGSGEFINGLAEALKDMKPGEKRLLVIPPDLAYGQNGFYSRNIPGQKRFVISPGEILILEVILVSII